MDEKKKAVLLGVVIVAALAVAIWQGAGLFGGGDTTGIEVGEIGEQSKAEVMGQDGQTLNESELSGAPPEAVPAGEGGP